MSKLLHIEASPRGERSSSITVAHHFVKAYQAANPDDTVETLDLWHAELPEFDGAAIEAKYAIMHGQAHTPDQAKAWQAVTKIAEQFKSADKFVLFAADVELRHPLQA